MRRTLVLDVVGLSSDLIGEHTPALSALAKENGGFRPIRPVTPAVTCTVQSSFLTGSLPREHGAVANGWYFRDLSEVWFWRQSNRLIAGEKVWEAAKKRNPAFSCAQLFWWYNMYSSADWTVTPRPMYPADGRKIPDIYTQPSELREELTGKLGEFPLFRFWGPAADIVSSRWIADAAIHLERTRKPTLSLVYLPHLDYVLQRRGQRHPEARAALREIDAIAGELIDLGRQSGLRLLILSEYAITAVDGAVAINRALREAKLIAIREELGRELLDPGASIAFAVADHQIAHVYVSRADRIGEVKALIEGLPGVERVLDEEGKRAFGLDHPRSGELVALSSPDRWFSYYWWLADDRAPDFARTVDIHRKPGYDPVELFLDPALKAPKLAVGWRLAKKALGFRTLMNVIPLDPSLVKGSHGRAGERESPILMSSEPALLPADGPVEAAAMKALILRHVFDET